MDVTFDCSYIARKHHHDLPQIGSCIETASGSEIYKLAGSCGRFEGVRMQRASFSIEGHAPNREETPDELGDSAGQLGRSPGVDSDTFDSEGLDGAKPTSCSRRRGRRQCT